MKEAFNTNKKANPWSQTKECYFKHWRGKRKNLYLTDILRKTLKFLFIKKKKRRRKWQPTQVFLPGESHGQRSLAGYSPQSIGSQESDKTQWLNRHQQQGWGPQDRGRGVTAHGTQSGPPQPTPHQCQPHTLICQGNSYPNSEGSYLRPDQSLLQSQKHASSE